MSKPLMFDLCCGVGGATEGFMAEGWHCIGIDIERHQCGEHRYPSQLWVQDILTVHGAQLRDADFIWASPPCQAYSYMAMPWKLGKAKAAAIRADTTGAELARLNRLFDACFRIQAEASLAAGRHIPMIVENVRGAQPWVGRSRYNFGSFHLWGDVPALMPITFKGSKVPGFRFDGSGASFQSASGRDQRTPAAHGSTSPNNTTSGKGRNPDGRKLKGCDCAHPETTPSGFAAVSVDCPFHGEVNDGPTITTCFPGPAPDGRKTGGAPHIRDGEVHTRHLTNPLEHEGVKQRGSGREWFAGEGKISRMTSSGSPARKMASAMIAKIPEPLSRYIGRTFLPR